jgi:BirA family transcriptional regulator, biotin operon repressor / biotin---[acetyl-CoA-carboxylase] ligase
MGLASKKITILEKVDSTNNYAMALVQNGLAGDENAVFTREQTNGKGRRGKVWDSTKDMNIAMSIMLEMQWLSVLEQFRLSIAVALACYDLISKYNPAATSIKWPNDIFIDDSKAGGILIENVIKGTLWQWAIIGIGLNINQVDFEKYNLSPISLKQISGKDHNCLEMAKELHDFVLKRINNLKSGEFTKMLEEYNDKLFARNRFVKLKKENIVFETKIIAVSAMGQLITQDVFERHFNFDEVEFKGLVSL